MAGQVKPIPEGHHALTPYLSIKGASDALEFYKKAFGATEAFRMAQPDGRIGRAELQVGDSRLMLAVAFPEIDFRSPRLLGGTPGDLQLHGNDHNAEFCRAVVEVAK